MFFSFVVVDGAMADLWLTKFVPENLNQLTCTSRYIYIMNTVTDPRFKSVHSDPRFKKTKKKDRKVTVDKRFKKLLSDKDFSNVAKVDKYGRKLDDDRGAKEISDLYNLEELDSESDESEKAETKQKEVAKVIPQKYDPARGEGLESSDEEEYPEDLPVDARDLIDPEPDRENILTGEVTSRFALVNLDWDHLRAEDLFVAMTSFKPATGVVKHVTVFPSEFGKERMAKEDVDGPPRAIFGNNEEGEDLDKPINAKTIVKESLGEEFDMTKLRQYQLDRLRYYYAIVECDSPETAKQIYDNCDGVEYESSANFFDLRFIPDGEVFEDEPRDQCSALPEAYEPAEFSTDALQHSKVKLTWDDDDPRKAQFAKKAFSKAEIDDMELKAYLASSDSEDGEDADAIKQKWKALLKSGEQDSEEERPTGNMEITFSAGLTKEKEEEVDPENETTIEKYKRKDQERKQRKRERQGIVTETEEKVDLGFDDPFFSSDAPKKKPDKIVEVDEAAEARKRAELDLVMMDDKADDGRNHFDMKNILRKEKQAGKKNKKFSKKKSDDLDNLQDDFELDTSDPRFAAAFDNDNHLFALDPTSSQFKKTKVMSKVLDERRKRSSNRDIPDEKPKRVKFKE